MKSMKWFSVAALCVGAAIVLFTACQKNASSSNKVPAGMQKFNLYLTDGPDINFQQVNVDVKAVIVLLETDSCAQRMGSGGLDDQDERDRDWDRDSSNSTCFHWDTLNIHPGVYNILNFQNGLDTLFSSTVLEPGKILKVKVVLGPDNSVMADSVLFHLGLPFGNTVTVNLGDGDEEQIDTATFALWLDFDAAHSIIEVSNQQFVLRPHIRLFTRQNSASLDGAVLPKAADAFVAVVSGSDTLIALPGDEGRFRVRGIKTATVDVTFFATANGYHDTTINNVQMKPGEETNLGTIYLH